MSYLAEVEPGDEAPEDQFPTAPTILPFPGGTVELGAHWPQSHLDDETPTTITCGDFGAEVLIYEARDSLTCLLRQCSLNMAARTRVSNALRELELAAKELA